MSRISATALTPVIAEPRSIGADRADLDVFLNLLITELRNQDPLDPVENSELLQQVGLIRDIQATNELTRTIEAVLAGNELATASSMIGQYVEGLTDAGDEVSGVVDRVVMERPGADGPARWRVQVGNETVRLENIRLVAASQPSPETE